MLSLTLALAGFGLILLAIALWPPPRVSERLVSLIRAQIAQSATTHAITSRTARVVAKSMRVPEDRAIAALATRWGRAPERMGPILIGLRAGSGLLIGLALTGAAAFFTEGKLGIAIVVALVFGLGLPAGWLLVARYLKSLQEAQLNQIARDMPNAMDLLLISLASGASLENGLSRVALEMSSVNAALANELANLNADLSVLGDYDQAFANLAIRIPMANVTDITSIIRDSLKNGAPIRDALSTAIGLQRERNLIRIDKLANEIPAKITTATMALCFPPLLLIIGGPPIMGLVDSLGP